MTEMREAVLDPFGFDEGGGDDGGEEDSPPPTVLTFTLGAQIFAVDVHRVQEILDRTAISPLPNAPHDVLGMIDLRGQGIAIVDLASRIGAPTANNADARIIVFEFPNGDHSTSLGVLAEKVLRVREMSDKDVEPVPETLSDWRCDVAGGMIRTEDGIAMILEIDRILCDAGRPGPFDFD
ncbi:chemotaxis protein CheW [Marinibacterium profundimaris]|uniref:chemotaxis protein CheW n=1 Tax=Marinibacterium profundimaris TaxID=1679460 RepID=UPI000B520349|nr:chemotaxis protein CheW [Marinibacterium profundimaris]